MVVVSEPVRVILAGLSDVTQRAVAPFSCVNSPWCPGDNLLCEESDKLATAVPAPRVLITVVHCFGWIVPCVLDKSALPEQCQRVAVPVRDVSLDTHIRRGCYGLVPNVMGNCSRPS